MSRLVLATTEDATEVAALRTAAAEHLTKKYGRGHWSHVVSEGGVLRSMRAGKVFVLRRRERVVGTVCLTPKKPWAIDPSYFSPVPRPLYLIAMAVAPELQGQGIGRRCLADVEGIAQSWPADSLRLDAYEGRVGAGGFYGRCGYTDVGRKVYRDVPLVYYEAILNAGAA